MSLSREKLEVVDRFGFEAELDFRAMLLDANSTAATGATVASGSDRRGKPDDSIRFLDDIADIVINAFQKALEASLDIDAPPASPTFTTHSEIIAEAGDAGDAWIESVDSIVLPGEVSGETLDMPAGQRLSDALAAATQGVDAYNRGEYEVRDGETEAEARARAASEAMGDIEYGMDVQRRIDEGVAEGYISQDFSDASADNVATGDGAGADAQASRPHLEARAADLSA